MTPTTTDAVYEYVRHYIEQYGYSPSHHEISRDCYIAESTVRYHLKKLAVEGRILFHSGKVRAIWLVNPGD